MIRNVQDSKKWVLDKSFVFALNVVSMHQPKRNQKGELSLDFLARGSSFQEWRKFVHGTDKTISTSGECIFFQTLGCVGQQKMIWPKCQSGRSPRNPPKPTLEMVLSQWRRLADRPMGQCCHEAWSQWSPLQNTSGLFGGKIMYKSWKFSLIKTSSLDYEKFRLTSQHIFLFSVYSEKVEEGR